MQNSYYGENASGAALPHAAFGLGDGPVGDPDASEEHLNAPGLDAPGDGGTDWQWQGADD